MSASDHLSQDQFPPLYHGTNQRFEPGDVLTPGHANHWGVPASRNDAVYLTTDPGAAHTYAKHAATKAGGEPAVYEVHPQGPAQVDFSDEDVADYRVASARVLRHIRAK